jgi:hypothetical protein
VAALVGAGSPALRATEDSIVQLRRDHGVRHGLRRRLELGQQLQDRQRRQSRPVALVGSAPRRAIGQQSAIEVTAGVQVLACLRELHMVDQRHGAGSPRLLPGLAATTTHVVIRVVHGVRALLVDRGRRCRCVRR